MLDGLSDNTFVHSLTHHPRKQFQLFLCKLRLILSQVIQDLFNAIAGEY